MTTEDRGLGHQEGKMKLEMEPKQEMARADGQLHPSAGGASPMRGISTRTLESVAYRTPDDSSLSSTLLLLTISSWYAPSLIHLPWDLSQSDQCLVAITPTIPAMRAVVADGRHVAVQLRFPSFRTP